MASPAKAAKNILVFLTGLLALVYLANPSAGLFELLPDNLPIIGNLDEAAATLLLLNCLAYFGGRIPGLMSNHNNKQTTQDRRQGSDVIPHE